MPDIVGNDANSTQAAVQAKMNETGEAIKSTVENHPMAANKLDIEDQVTSPFDTKIAELNQQDPYANAAAVKRLQQAKIALLNKFDETGKAVAPQNLSSMTPSEIWEYRKTKIDPMTKFTGNISDDKVVNEAYQEARQNLKSTMNSVMPELKPLNRDYGDLVSADDALDRMRFKAQKEGISGLSIKHIITAGLDSPITRAKVAQFLYTAPKSEIASLEQQVPSMAEVVKSWFPSEDAAASKSFDYFPKLGMAGKAGESTPISRGGEVTPEIVAGKGVAELPSPQKPILRQDRALPSPRQAGQSSGPVINQEAPPKSFEQYSKENPLLAEKWKTVGKGLSSIALAGGLVAGGNAEAKSSLTPNEESVISRVAKSYSLNPEQTKLLKVIRLVENGGPGKEFGVLTPQAMRFKNNPQKSLETQAKWAAGTIKNHYDGNIDRFAKRWAPLKAKNDPKGLNKNWAQNAKFYMNKLSNGGGK